VTPRALAAARAALVRRLIRARSFSASAANRCKMNGPTRNGRIWDSRARGWRCSIRRIANFLEREPAQLPAWLLALRFGIERLHHARGQPEDCPCRELKHGSIGDVVHRERGLPLCARGQSLRAKVEHPCPGTSEFDAHCNISGMSAADCADAVRQRLCGEADRLNPNTDWLAGSGVALDPKGFALTGAQAGGNRRTLETSRQGIFAIGDIRSGSVKRAAAADGEGA
jgi:hypothetical protein